VGGNLAKDCPTADLATPLLALQAIIRLHSVAGNQLVPLENLWDLPKKTPVDQHLITEVLVPCAPREGQLLGSFQKLTTIGSYMALATIGIVIEFDQKGQCIRAGVALGCACQTPVRLPAAERLLAGQLLSHKIIVDVSAEIAKDSPLQTDHRASREYRREVGRHLATKALEEIASRRSGPL